MDLLLFAQFQQQQPQNDFGPFFFILQTFNVLMAILSIVGMWRVFEKAGEPGWASIVPIYNLIVMYKISGKPTWWAFLFLCPCVFIVTHIIAMISLAANFGRSGGFGVGLALLGGIFFPILGFSDAKYNPVDEDGRPRRRQRRDDDYDDEDDDRARRRPRDDDDDDDRPRSRRRPDDDDDDDDRIRPKRR